MSSYTKFTKDSASFWEGLAEHKFAHLTAIIGVGGMNIKYNIEVEWIEWIERDIEDARKAVEDAERELKTLEVRLLG